MTDPTNQTEPVDDPGSTPPDPATPTYITTPAPDPVPDPLTDPGSGGIDPGLPTEPVVFD